MTDGLNPFREALSRALAVTPVDTDPTISRDANAYIHLMHPLLVGSPHADGGYRWSDELMVSGLSDEAFDLWIEDAIRVIRRRQAWMGLVADPDEYRIIPLWAKIGHPLMLLSMRRTHDGTVENPYDLLTGTGILERAPHLISFAATQTGTSITIVMEPPETMLTAMTGMKLRHVIGWSDTGHAPLDAALDDLTVGKVELKGRTQYSDGLSRVVLTLAPTRWIPHSAAPEGITADWHELFPFIA